MGVMRLCIYMRDWSLGDQEIWWLKIQQLTQCLSVSVHLPVCLSTCLPPFFSSSSLFFSLPHSFSFHLPSLVLSISQFIPIRLLHPFPLPITFSCLSLFFFYFIPTFLSIYLRFLLLLLLPSPSFTSFLSHLPSSPSPYPTSLFPLLPLSPP